MRFAFLGNMNNMAYQVAKYMRAKGVDVTLFVDAPSHYLLDRPEAWDAELARGYPDWIVDLKNLRIAHGSTFIFSVVAFRGLLRRLNCFDVVVLNGNWIALGAHVRGGVVVANMFAGSDLDYCAPEMPAELASASEGGVPKWLLRAYYSILWTTQARGIRRAQLVNYYLPGVNPRGDEVLGDIKRGQEYRRLALRGIDCEKFPYAEPEERDVFEILSVMRFFFRRERNENKRNDVMIEGIGRFVERVGPEARLRLTFFEKGSDVEAAKELLRKRGLDSLVSWQREVPVDGLLPFFRRADVAFDQLGAQWVGAGLFSMLVGRPLIANGRADLYMRSLGVNPPICQATTADEVCMWLERLYRDRALGRRIGRESSLFVREWYDMNKTVEFLLSGAAYFSTKHDEEGSAD